MDHGNSAHGHNLFANRRALAVALVLLSFWFVVEFVGGLVTRSLALLADAGHMLSDVAAVGLALFALWYSSRPATPTKSYGYYRTETLAALLNGFALFIVAVYVTWEAIRRIRAVAEVDSGTMLAIAVVGLAVNAAAGWVLLRYGEESLNVRAALLHVFGDALGSIGAIIAGATMLLTGWYIVDPLVSIVIAVIIVVSGVRLLRQTLDVLLEGVPSHIDLLQVRDAMLRVAGIRGVHDLHIWTLTSGCVAMSAHAILVPPRSPTDSGVLMDLRHLVKERFGIDHLTVQLEPHDLPDEDVHVAGDPRCLA